jgi:hypothetical protein
MTKRLLDRQSRLIHFLTSGSAIFDDADQSVDSLLQGIDRHLLGLEARFSFEKRMQKITAVFPLTFELLGSYRETLVRRFVESCPPFDIGRLENAQQFYDFLSAHWRREPPAAPHLPDVAACELAFASARILAEGRSPDEEKISTRASAPSPSARRSPAVVLLRCAHDIRPLFESVAAAGYPTARDVPLAIVAQGSAEHPEIFELAPEVFDLLSSLNDWADQATFDESEDARKLIADLANLGLVEIRR